MRIVEESWKVLVTATAEDDAPERADRSTAGLAAPDDCAEDALTRDTGEAPEEGEDSLFGANGRPLESRSRFMRCRSVPISAACW